MTGTVPFEELREDVQAMIEAKRHASVQEYLATEGDCSSDPAPERYAAVDDMYHGFDDLGEYDNAHGSEDGALDMEQRSPAMAMVHEELAKAWRYTQELDD